MREYAIALPSHSLYSNSSVTWKYTANQPLHLLRIHIDESSISSLLVSKVILGHTNLSHPENLGQWTVADEKRDCSQLEASQLNLLRFKGLDWKVGETLAIELYNRYMSCVQIYGCVWVEGR